MNNFLKSIVEWMMEKEEEMAKECAIPMKEIDYQITKVQEQKETLKKNYEDSMQELDSILQRLQKIKNTEILRCQSSKK